VEDLIERRIAVRKRMYKNGFAPGKDGGDEVRDPGIDLA
jgi:hypothetical protein